MVEIDTKAIATNISQRAVDRILAVAEGVVREYWARFKNRDVGTYAEYLARKGAIAGQVRTLVNDNKFSPLYDIYVPESIKFPAFDDSKIIDGNSLLVYLSEDEKQNSKRKTRAISVVGTAGVGKSMFIKHAFFEMQKVKAHRVPVLIELRSFNAGQIMDLEGQIVVDFARTGAPISREQVLNGLESGLFALLFDGVDEMKPLVQSHYIAEINRFVRQYPLCPILVSTRPGLKTASWLTDAKPILPMDVDAAKKLIWKLDFDEKIKAEFARKLHETFFQTHFEFASVPLLCIIMLLTFASSGKVSTYEHEFYEDAFTALWSRHDNRKEGFERHRFTDLVKSDFRRLLSALSVSSYEVGDYEMRPADFQRHFAFSVQFTGLKCKEEDFLRELIENTCIMLNDGPYIKFFHRSFQEYFAALFVSELDEEAAARIIDDLIDRLDTDNVLPLLLSINAHKVEGYWVLPKIGLISNMIDQVGGNLAKYAEEAMLGGSISTEMNKIRRLYGFSPSNDDLAAAFDAFHHMNKKIEQSEKSIFSRDRDNFQRLMRSIQEKYRRRDTALRNLLARKVPD